MNTEKVWDRDAVITLINNSNLACGKALWSLYERQTADEQASEHTTHRNGVGFNGRDAEFLSSVAKRLPDYGFTMTDKQLPHVRRAIKKYTRQLLEIIEAKGGKVEIAKARKGTGALSLKNPIADSSKSESAKPLESEIAKTPTSAEHRDQFGLF